MRFVAEIFEGLAIALDAIRVHKLRAALTTLGVIIGVLTVTLMSAAINGIKTSFSENVMALGADTLYVSRMDWFIGSPDEWIKQSRRPRITLEQIRQLERLLPPQQFCIPYAEGTQPVKFKTRTAEAVEVVGTTDKFILATSARVAQGRFLTPAESDGARPVCVIGANVAANLFEGEPALGSRIWVGRNTFEVVGVFEKQGEAIPQAALDDAVVIPVGQFITQFRREPDFTVLVKTGDPGRLGEAREELRGAMRRVRRLPPDAEDDFAINSQESYLDLFNRVGGRIAAAGLFVTGLALFVGGIGIMNIMFVTVAERTYEIGLRKAVGARQRAILVQFLIEAACIALIGGVIALLLAWPGTWLLQLLVPAAMSVPTMLLALAVSLLTGLVAGFVPAWRAAKMKPVEALRHE
ncbi:MAG: ABC transporter permease [Verrucomicrobiae bacterium]|nr:ABC transporter permease [Verrucomicrobiae bacterium]MCX7721556.1 ABC transporter permease [Verrucomicrobiae bacterium]MDW7980411.1 ABC transporter permease [Verrucomicrobiales bacterium]